MIATHVLDAIRERIDIVDLVGTYVPLKRAGTSFSGLCPFHKEKSPSFHVHPQKQIFHCFGCHKGGNIFTFLSAVEGLNFPDAVRKLADRAGVVIEETRRDQPTASRNNAEHERLYEALEWAAKYFHYLLFEKPEGRFAKDYANGRGLEDEVLKRFRVGVSPRGWTTLTDCLVKRGFTHEELIATGLVVLKEDAGAKSSDRVYDRFRDRLMFPIRNPDGRVVGFGARILREGPGQPQAKYLNSPESPLFSKRRILYGIAENQRGIRLRQEAVLVEGYMDVVGLANKGVDNAVASMGTAFTEEHCREIRKLTKRVVTVFDADQAGQDAWQRSVHLFLQAGLVAKDLSLPDGKDPDEFVLEAGQEKFYEMCGQAQRQVTKLLREVAAKGALPESERARYLELFTPILLASRAATDRVLLWDELSLVLQVSVESLRAVAESALKRAQMAKPEAPKAAQVNTGSAYRPGYKPRPPKKKPDALGTDLLGAALRNPAKFRLLPPAEWKDCVTDSTIAAVLERLSVTTSDDDFRKELGHMMQESHEDQMLGTLSEALLREEKPTREDDAWFEAVRAALARKRKEVEVRALTLQVKLSGGAGQSDEALRQLEQARILRATRPPTEGSAT